MEPTQNQNSTPNTNGAGSASPAETATSQTAHTPEVNNNLLMGILCYLGPLVLIPYLTSLDNSFVKYHVRQGIVLFGIEVIIYILGSMFVFSGLYPIIMLLNLGTLILMIIGIVNVVGNKEVPLPLVGQFADKVKI